MLAAANGLNNTQIARQLGVEDDTVRLWHVAGPAKPRLAAMLTGPAHAVDAVAFSPDGDELAAGSYDDRVWLWNITKPAKPMLAQPR